MVPGGARPGAARGGICGFGAVVVEGVPCASSGPVDAARSDRRWKAVLLGARNRVVREPQRAIMGRGGEGYREECRCRRLQRERV